MPALTIETIITCPHCGGHRRETMPTNSCVYFYECASCHALLHPRPGDCCVFCSYGSVPCPHHQQHTSRPSTEYRRPT